MNGQHAADRVIDDIVGGFRVFAITLVVIFAAIAIANTLTNNKFPISNDSSWFVSFVFAAFVAFANFVKGRNKSYFS